ncbi:unnamed protein product [Euphydryas editha]|uniref:Reverse transcriptase domain-containing protein n=1 Tax=Euphydryas editha TaxID=104508 RepID=A0AAU9V944_EUPED|nr:unnamed protein product [Euphydryas editha]
MPKQFALAKILQNAGIGEIKKVKYVNPYKIRLETNNSWAEKIEECKEFTDRGWRIQRAMEVSLCYGVIKDVDIDLKDEDILNKILCPEPATLISVCRLKRREHSSEGNIWKPSESTIVQAEINAKKNISHSNKKYKKEKEADYQRQAPIDIGAPSTWAEEEQQEEKKKRDVTFNELLSRLQEILFLRGVSMQTKVISMSLAQGDPLSPILFNIITANICKSINNIHISQFADDFVLYTISDFLDEGKSQLQAALTMLTNLLSNIGLEISPSKSTFWLANIGLKVNLSLITEL